MIINTAITASKAKINPTGFRNAAMNANSFAVKYVDLKRTVNIGKQAKTAVTQTN
ncbi:MAG: hypothetical protein V7K47_09705 [Nostoc sp.]